MKIFVGHESAHPEMFEVCAASIRRYSNIEIVRLEKPEEYLRPFEGESTDFAFTRFLVPYLSNYSGISIFCDGDFLWRCDPAETVEYLQGCVAVVKHPMLITQEHAKMDGKVNRPYARKYWSSLMVFDNEKCKVLTPLVVNTQSAEWLHRLEWAGEDISELPATYNYLVGYYGFDNPKAVHFTDGGPWLSEYKNVPFSKEWNCLL